MEYMSFYFFVIGLVVASFLNAMAYRIEKGFLFPKILVKPSHCEECGKILTWVELIPVISFFMYRGRCRKCDSKVFWYYPISEFVLGFTFLLVWQTGVSFYILIPICILFFLSYFDMTSKSIPRIFVNLALAYGLLDLFVRYLLASDVTLLYPTLVAVGVAVGLLILNYFKKSFGLGDILLLIFLSTSLAINQLSVFLLMTLFFSSSVAAILVFKDRKWAKKYIPLVPFMYLGFVSALLYSEQIARAFANTVSLW